MRIKMSFNPFFDHYPTWLILCEEMNSKDFTKRNCYSSLTQSKGNNWIKYDLEIHGVIGGNNNQLWRITHIFQTTLHRHSSCFWKRVNVISPSDVRDTIFFVIESMYVAHKFIYQSLFLVYILAYKFDILQIFKSTVYRTRILIGVSD